MNLPISWVVGGVIPASQAVKQVASLAATSASHFFGELLQTNPPALANGRSVQIEQTQNQKASREKESWTDRVQSLRSYLSKVVADARVRYGLPTDLGNAESLSISSTGKGQPGLDGPEPMRTELEHYLQEHPALIHEINELALQSTRSEPLRLLPKQELNKNANEPWKLWIDAVTPPV